MKKIAIALATAFLAQSAFAADMNEAQKTLYSIGLTLGIQANVLNLTPEEMEPVIKGFTDAIRRTKPEVSLEAYGPQISKLVRERMDATAAKQMAADKVFVENAAKEAGAVKTESGLVYRALTEGTGASPKLSDNVEVHYRGTLINGSEFDSSYKRNQPAQFPLNGVIKCWGEGLQKMKTGGKAQLICPPAIAYGDASMGGAIPANSTLIFEVELLRIVEPANTAPAESKPAPKAAVKAPPKKK